MDTSERLQTWLGDMDYDQTTPTNLNRLCNPSTAFVWEQFIRYVKPKEKIAHIKHNILVNRLLQNNERCQPFSTNVLADELQAPVREIGLWKRKQKLEQQVNVLRERVQHAETKLDATNKSNKTKYLQLDNLKKKVARNRQQAFVFKAKSKELEVQNDNVQEMLTAACNLTPNENEDYNKTDVLETLKKCAAKLEKIVQKKKLPDSSLNCSTILPLRTPFKRGFDSATRKLTSSFFSSTKIESSNTLKVKRPRTGLDDSLGLLDESNMTFDNALAASSFCDANLSCITQYDLLILNDDELNKLVGELLKINRSSLSDILDESNKTIKMDLINVILNSEMNNCSRAKIDKHEVTPYATHVEYELKIRRVKLSIRKLEERLSKIQEEFYNRLLETNINKQLIDNLQQRQQATGITAAFDQAKQLIASFQRAARNENKLKQVTETNRLLKERNSAKLVGIEQQLNVFKQFCEAMSHIRNETSSLTRKLELFTHDPTWTASLAENSVGAKVGALFEFPLEYNRAFRTEDGSTIFNRDLPLNNIPYQDSFDSNQMLALAMVLKNPSSCTEGILYELLRRLNRIEKIKDSFISETEPNIKINRHTAPELLAKDLPKKSAIEKLAVFTNSGPTKAKISELLKDVIESNDMWLEMPVRKFISDEVLVDGNPYKHYETIYNDYYNQLL